MKSREVFERNLYVDDSGRVVAYEELGVLPPWGGYLEAYMIDDQGNCTRDWYADHTCSSDTWGAPVEPEALPEKAKAVLGKPVEQVLSAQAGSFRVLRP